MALFSALRQERRDDAELGKGVWRRVHDRFRRGLDRYHQILEGAEDDALYNELALVGNDLADLLPRVRALCTQSQKRFPSSGQDVPGALTQVHRALSKAGNSLAATAESAAMSRLDAERWGVNSAGLQNVQRRAEIVAEDVASAEDLLGA